MTRIEAEMAQYPETGIVNPFVHTKLYLSQEMIDFFNGYLLEYKDYPDAKIAWEFATKFGFAKEGAKEIEHAYVVVNRERIYKRIKNLHKSGKTREDIIEQIQSDFGLDEVNAEKYVRRCMMDKNYSIQEELAKALYKFSYGGLTGEQAEKRAEEVMKNFDPENEALAHKGINWYAKQILKSMNNAKNNNMSKQHILEAGLQALEERLGIVDTIRFLQYFDNGGSGDYTKEKYEKEDSRVLAEFIEEEVENSETT